ncbi:MAG: S8 family serine peptidase, partial [Gammaproteobacteria bacterium]|nr:S8 family serine peptidase [Gammaproteobacteria bacterium]
MAKDISGAAARGETQRYIVILDDPPLASYDGRLLSTPERNTASTILPATANLFTGASKLDVESPASIQYLRFLDERLKSFQAEAALNLGRKLKPSHRYRNALNGFATELSLSEVEVLRSMPRVKSVSVDKVLHLQTDSGPRWLGADKLHEGSAGFEPTGGQGIVVGVIDSGVNWDHPSFEDPGFPGWDHVNPYGSQLGLCTDPEVRCNDKLVGVYDFVQDNPNTESVEENTRGEDNSGHGSHVASTAAGNPVDALLSGLAVQIAGVAPNANIVSYRVCYIGDPNDGEDDGCQSSAIISAIDQAITDGVDVINYSIGGGDFSPWLSGESPRAFLNARAAGIFVATSAGNSGPEPGTIGSPANAPWIVAVGNASHDRLMGSLVENLSGGDTTPPGVLVGQSIVGGIGIRKIVHARDFGNALCGDGDAELGSSCSENTGDSSPWRNDNNVFNGEIVVCDRGTYGRIEKGKNVLLAGAGGYILANMDEQGESLVADQHCLPATHIGDRDGDLLRTWLDSGSGHQGSISGFDLYQVAEAGDQISSGSSRGPSNAPVEGVMKPDLIAPGSSIYAAIETADDFGFKSGTSMASPHVAGAGALLKAVHPEWTPSMLTSALLTTATPELAQDYDGS